MDNKHDVRIDRKKIHPRLDFKMGKLLDKCAGEGIYLIITEGFRTKEYQDKLYEKGRKDKGSIVTNADGNSFSSQHQWGIAFDIAINDKKKMYDSELIGRVARIAKKVKLGWGGDWKKFPDNLHFYLTKWGDTTAELKRRYGTFDNFRKTWTAETTRRIRMFNNTAESKVIIRIPKGKKVDVIYRKLWYAKVKYRGNIGYVRKKYIR